LQIRADATTEATDNCIDRSRAAVILTRRLYCSTLHVRG